MIWNHDILSILNLWFQLPEGSYPAFETKRRAGSCGDVHQRYESRWSLRGIVSYCQKWWTASRGPNSCLIYIYIYSVGLCWTAGTLVLIGDSLDMSQRFLLGNLVLKWSMIQKWCFCWHASGEHTNQLKLLIYPSLVTYSIGEFSSPSSFIE